MADMDGSIGFGLRDSIIWILARWPTYALIPTYYNTTCIKGLSLCLTAFLTPRRLRQMFSFCIRLSACHVKGVNPKVCSTLSPAAIFNINACRAGNGAAIITGSFNNPRWDLWQGEAAEGKSILEAGFREPERSIGKCPQTLPFPFFC